MATPPENAEAVTARVLDEWKAFAFGSREALDLDLTQHARAIATRLEEIRSPSDAAAVVAAVFAEAYPNRRFQFDRYSCTSVGTRLYRELRSSGLLA